MKSKPLNNASAEAVETVYRYHDRTKHHLNRYARSAGYLDWANQPNPFRRYEGAPLLRLEIPSETPAPAYDELYGARSFAATLDAGSFARLFYYSLALSAWKQVTTSTGRVQSRWSLRVKPSSGNLHPTEAYLICGPIPGLCDSPAVYHYAPFEHALELRRKLDDGAGLPTEAFFIGLTSVHWRESWKYGERAFRYCQHDAGHAVGALTIAAAAQGWTARLDDATATRELAELLGVHGQEGVEAEHADCLLAFAPAGRPFPALPALRGAEWLGVPNRLSASQVPWTVIDEVAAATVSSGLAHDGDAYAGAARELPERGLPAARIIRQRRSAVALDGVTTMGRDAFLRMLWRVMPAAAPMPFSVLPWQPLVSLAIFVHRVNGVTPGLYALVRDPSHAESLRASMLREFLWEQADAELPLFLLVPADATDAAKTISCHQDIASMGVFAAGMLAAFDAAIAGYGAPAYPRMFWETGLVGQVLYLEAEAAGIRATGIGCFFDDACHRLLGIKDHAWQSLYHFTMGGPVDDPRLQTVESYEHLKARAAGGDDAWPEA
ncbi:MAG: nitroreductase family protein [Bryobacteraceae bacterium]|nr:nitroreductase family protein [Bryobacteraceae bacterium]